MPHCRLANKISNTTDLLPINLRISAHYFSDKFSARLWWLLLPALIHPVFWHKSSETRLLDILNFDMKFLSVVCIYRFFLVLTSDQKICSNQFKNFAFQHNMRNGPVPVFNFFWTLWSKNEITAFTSSFTTTSDQNSGITVVFDKTNYVNWSHLMQSF